MFVQGSEVQTYTDDPMNIWRKKNSFNSFVETYVFSVH